MNVFRLLGDLSHLGAIIILLLKIWKTRSCAGISGKTQAMFALVFITRYLDLFVHFVSLYNTGTDQICFYSCKQSYGIREGKRFQRPRIEVIWTVLDE